jgi:hypothetical protein
MSLEIWIPRIRQIARPIDSGARQALLTDLRSFPSDNDGRRDIPWRRGVIYFHSIQDVAFAADESNIGTPRQLARETKSNQACFVKDLDYYFKSFPATERNAPGIPSCV